MVAKGYNIRKAAQVVAFFVLKEGKQINVLKIVKLLYLAEKKFLEIYDSPILYDRFVSMNNGPVTSITYDYIKGELENKAWDEFIAARANHQVGLAKSSIAVQHLDELSRAETEVLEETYEQFGHMDGWQLVDYTHKNCPEWEDPHGTSTLIPYERVFKSLKKKNSEALAQAVEEERVLSNRFDQ
jgi:uncharacterized phage-associated protein